MARSGDAPRGFFMIEGPGPPCAERPGRPARSIAISSHFNALFHTRLDQLPGDCGALSAAVRRRLGPEGLAFPGHLSVACERGDPGSDTIELVVYALAGPWQESGPGEPQSRKAVYFAAMGTTRAQLDADLARFRHVLASTRIGLMR